MKRIHTVYKTQQDGQYQSSEMNNCNAVEGYPEARTHTDVLACVSARGSR